MKVILAHNYYQQSGGEDQAFRNEAKLLRSEGHQVIEYVRSNREIERYNLADKLTLGARTVWAWGSAQELREILKLHSPHVVHFHNTFPLISPAAYYACNDASVPVVQTLHNYRLCCPAATFVREGRLCEDCVAHNLSRSVWHACYRNSRLATAASAAMLQFHRLRGTWTTRVQAFICLSEFQRMKLTTAGLPAGRSFVKPNFVSPDPGVGSRAELGPAVFVGRLSKEKGLSTLLRAWEMLDRAGPLRIMGDGELRRGLEQQIRDRRISNVRLEGRRRHEDVLTAIKSAPFLVFPSEWYEGLPMTILEAFACGIPVIASRFGAMEEIVEDGRTGLHFAPGNPADLAAKARWAFDHPRELEQMARNARAEYEAKYTAERNYHQLIEIYERVISSARESRSVKSHTGGQDATWRRPEARLTSGSQQRLEPIILSALPANPLISVLVANYNYATYLPQSIDSVLRQTYSNFELIVCDDGSTDGSRTILSRYQSADARVRILLQENAGQAAALNAGFQASRGEIICFLDSDDSYGPEKIEKVVAAFTAHPDSGFVIHKLLRIDASRSRSLGEIPLAYCLPSGWLGAVAPLDAPWVPPGIPPCSALSLRRDVAERLFPLPVGLRAYADTHIQTLAPLITPVVAVSCSLGEYRIHGRNAAAVTRFTEMHLRRLVEFDLELWKAWRRFLVGSSCKHPIQLEPALTHNSYAYARFRRDPEAKRIYNAFVAGPRFRGLPALYRAFWKVSSCLPDWAFCKLFDLLQTRQSAKVALAGMLRGIRKARGVFDRTDKRDRPPQVYSPSQSQAVRHARNNSSRIL